MDDDYYWIAPVVIIITGCAIFLYGMGNVNGETSGRNKGIAYCMEHPENCAIEYTYMKLKEKSK